MDCTNSHQSSPGRWHRRQLLPGSRFRVETLEVGQGHSFFLKSTASIFQTKTSERKLEPQQKWTVFWQNLTTIMKQIPMSLAPKRVRNRRISDHLGPASSAPPRTYTTPLVQQAAQPCRGRASPGRSSQLPAACWKLWSNFGPKDPKHRIKHV